MSKVTWYVATWVLILQCLLRLKPPPETSCLKWVVVVTEIIIIIVVNIVLSAENGRGNATVECCNQGFCQR